MISLIEGILSDWPTATVVVNKSSYYTPNCYQGQSSLSALYGYRAVIDALVATENTAHPGRVFLGDSQAYAEIASNPPALLNIVVNNYSNSLGGTAGVHPSDAGARI